MKKVNSLVKGTLILSTAGIITRLIGFIFRIFLSRILGAEALGLYQLLLPLSFILYAICCYGISVSISKFSAQSNNSNVLYSGILISLFISAVVCSFFYFLSDLIADLFFHHPESGLLIKILCAQVPAGCIHLCINSYYLGKKNASIPAFAMFTEQIFRVLCVYIIWKSFNAYFRGPEIAFLGGIFGELGACFLLVIFYIKDKKNIKKINILSIKQLVKPMFTTAVPVSLNRILITVLSCIECTLIPFVLTLYGLTMSDALSIFGVLTGMALPIVLFPSTIVTSLSTMMLPEVASMSSDINHLNDNSHSWHQLASRTLNFCCALGIFCTAIFSTFGAKIGGLLFGNQQVTSFVSIMGWICPFIYLNSTCASIYNGMGKTTFPFAINLTCTIIKILGIVFTVPRIGIVGYLSCYLVCNILESILYVSSLVKNYRLNFSCINWILIPSGYASLGILCAIILDAAIFNPFITCIFKYGNFVSYILSSSIILLAFFIWLKKFYKIS